LFWVKAFWTWIALTLVLKVGMGRILTGKGAALSPRFLRPAKGLQRLDLETGQSGCAGSTSFNQVPVIT